MIQVPTESHLSTYFSIEITSQRHPNIRKPLCVLAIPKSKTNLLGIEDDNRHANSPDFGGRLPIFFVDFTSRPIIDYNQQNPNFSMICHEFFIFVIFLCYFVNFSGS